MTMSDEVHAGCFEVNLAAGHQRKRGIRVSLRFSFCFPALPFGSTLSSSWGMRTLYSEIHVACSGK